MRMRSSCARASATCASATSSAAWLWSTALWLTKPCASSSRLQVGTRDGRLRLRLLQLCGLQPVVELHQQLALAHALAVGEAEGDDAPADLGAQHHRLPRAQRADGRDLVVDAHRRRATDLDDGRPAGTARPTAGAGPRRAGGPCSAGRPRGRGTGLPRRHRARAGPGTTVLEPPCCGTGQRDADHGHRNVQRFHVEASFQDVAAKRPRRKAVNCSGDA
jgi:hypothetical protein